MSKPIKNLIVDTYKKKFDGLSGAVVIDVRGIKSNENNNLRADLAKDGIKVTVIKNSLAKSAFNKTVMEGSDPTVAAIASSAAAEYYGAEILKREIEDNRENYTRFFLLARKAPKLPAKSAGEMKTSIAFITKNSPGSLFRCMSALALRDLSLTKIESRPLKGRPWEYMFYVDFLGSPEDPRWRYAMNQLEEMTEQLAVLGCYPQAT